MSTRLPSKQPSDILTSGLGLVIALPREAAGLFGRVSWSPCGDQLRCCTVHQGGRPIRVVCSGPGPQNACRATRWLASRRARVIGSIGVSGALSRQVHTGDLVLADEIVRWTGEAYERVWPPHTAFFHSLQTQLREARLHVHSGRILSVERPVLTVEEKMTHAKGSRALAADMESAGVAQAAEEAGIPFFVLRAVSDPADMGIPGFVPDCLDSKGGIRAGYLCRQLIKNPFRLIVLFRVHKGFRSGLRQLEMAWKGPLQRVVIPVNP
ncbi:MAG: hypothetical protein U5R49_18255 [Deltaproteobacteria bacterium]|nr:hypothetical protein [Deltaproteobacteria bacterium]